MYAPYLYSDSPLIDLAVLAGVEASMARDLIADWSSRIKTSPCSFASVQVPALFLQRIGHVARFDHTGKPGAIRAGDGKHGLRLWFLRRGVGHSYTRIQVLLTTRHPYIRLLKLLFFHFLLAESRPGLKLTPACQWPCHNRRLALALSNFWANI
jgi:hypothetical protein